MSISREKPRASVLLIYTGGTIGMKEDAGTGALKPFDFSGIMEEVPELRKFAGHSDSNLALLISNNSIKSPVFW